MPSIDVTAKCPRCDYPLTGINAARCPECGHAVAPGAALAVYRERYYGHRRDFTLFADRVHVRRRTRLGSVAEAAVPLAELNPLPSSGRGWPGALKPALTLFAVGAGFVLFVLYARVTDVMSGAFVWIAGAAGLVGLVVAALHAKRVEYVSFHAVNRSDVRLLVIERRGPDAAAFDEFGQAVRRGVAATLR